MTSARTLPLLRSTHSSILGRYSSMMRGRRPGPLTGAPLSRAATYRRTVLGSTPANSPAECAHSVASNASRISMISLSDFFMRPSGGLLVGGRRPRAHPRRAAIVRTDTARSHSQRQGDQLSVSREARVRLQGDWHVRYHPTQRATCTCDFVSHHLPDALLWGLNWSLDSPNSPSPEGHSPLTTRYFTTLTRESGLNHRTQRRVLRGELRVGRLRNGWHHTMITTPDPRSRTTRPAIPAPSATAPGGRPDQLRSIQVSAASGRHPRPAQRSSTPAMKASSRARPSVSSRCSGGDFIR